MPRLNFNEEIEDISDERSQLPEGWYRGHLVNSYFQDFKNGNGVSLVLDFSVDHNNRPRRIRSYNTWVHNTSPEAMKWGQVAVKQLFRACGKPKSEDSEDCHNIPIEILIYEGEKYNVVKGYRKLAMLPDGTQPRTSTQSSPAPVSAAPQSSVLASHVQKFDDDVIPF
jgi:hypothetical protein